MRGYMLFTVAFLLLFSISIFAQNKDDIVVAEIDGEEITLSEFEKAYAKNSGGYEESKDDSLSAYKDFLNLYVIYRMKLADADERGYNEDPALQKELDEYKKSVGISYLLEKEFLEPQLRRMWELRKKEWRVSHIMFNSDSTRAESRVLADSILKRALAGEDFGQLAKEYSIDKFTKDNGGDIYYFTEGNVIPEFADPVFETPEGEIHPAIVKSRGGFHIIKVTEIRKRIPQVRVSHILIDYYDNESGEVDSALAKTRIDSIKMMLDNGADFSELAKEYSEDQSTAENGGDLGFIERRKTVQPFDSAAFNLPVGEISGIIQTPYGYHILKVTEHMEYPTFEEDKEELRRMHKQLRYEQEYEAFLDSLREKYNFVMYNQVIDTVVRLCDSIRFSQSYWDTEWRNDFKDETIFSIAGENISLDSLVSFAQNHPDLENAWMNIQSIKKAVRENANDKVLTEEAMKLDQHNEEFAKLMNDYRKGIYIFQLQEDEIWSKIELDSTKLYDLWEKNKDKYRWEDRVQFAEIFARKDSVINHYYDLLKAGENFDTLAMEKTERFGYKEKAGLWSKKDVDFNILTKTADKLENPGDISEPFENSGGWSIVKLVEKDPARIKTFTEAKAEVAGLYQDLESKRLEEEYIKRLKDEYEPEYYYEELENAFTESGE